MLEHVLDIVDKARFVPEIPECGGTKVPGRAFNRAVLLSAELQQFDSGDEIWGTDRKSVV